MSEVGVAATVQKASMSLKKGSQGFMVTTAFSLAFFIGCVAGTFFLLFRASQLDREAYVSLMAESNPTHADKSKRTAYTASQERRQVRKEMFFLSGGARLQLQLLCSASILRLHQQSGGTKLIEEMTKVKSYMQEELFYLSPTGAKSPSPVEGGSLMQMVCCCEAESAVYFYQTEICQAEDVQIARYIVPGHTLRDLQLETLVPIMKGKANSVEFSMGGGELNFKASQLKATWNGA